MAEKRAKRSKKSEPERAGKISLYGLSIEDALRAAAKTGRPPPLPTKPKLKPKKRTESKFR
jgi:hypothetical protein